MCVVFSGSAIIGILAEWLAVATTGNGVPCVIIANVVRERKPDDVSAMPL